MIVQELFEMQKRFGYLPDGELKALGERLGVPLRRLHEVASFYPHYRLEPARLEVRVCRDMACHMRGAPEYQRALEATAREIGGGKIEVGGVSCLGQCDQAPACLVGHNVYRGGSIADYQSLLRPALMEHEGLGPGAPPQLADTTPKGWQVDPYDGREIFSAVRKFLDVVGADGLIEELKTADLRGMGGAGVWAHQKWNDVRQARGDEKYVVCNADESEPATFKDRELLLRTPHIVIEGMILGALVTGARKGFVYIRHEYEQQIEVVREAIERAREIGACGDDIFGSGRSFDLEVFVSPGGYVCGEQSALIEAIEDKRSEPRNKPPQLETNGLYDKPTLLSNVETFAWVPSIALRGGAWYRDAGVNGSKGLRFFSICGDLVRPGVYEVPIGLPFGELIYNLAGGLRDGQKLKAVAPSGPSGGFLPPLVPLEDLPERARKALPPGVTHLDLMTVNLDLQSFRELGLMLGAGLVVYGDRSDLIEQSIVATKFFRNESCGKCVPCRLGSQRLVEVGARVRGGRMDKEGLAQAEDLLGELVYTMEMTSICGLGMSAGKALVTALRYFKQDLAPHLRPAEAAPAPAPPGVERRPEAESAPEAAAPPSAKPAPTRPATPKPEPAKATPAKPAPAKTPPAKPAAPKPVAAQAGSTGEDEMDMTRAWKVPSASHPKPAVKPPATKTPPATANPSPGAPEPARSEPAVPSNIPADQPDGPGLVFGDPDEPDSLAL